MVVVLVVAGVYGLLPRLGGLAREAEALRNANVLLVAAAVGAEVASLLVYVIFYRRVLAAMGARVSMATVFDVTMASFLVSHIAMGGSAAGAIVNIEAMQEAGVDRETAGEAVAFATLLSSLALFLILALGLGLSLRHEVLPAGYVAAIALAELLVLGAFAFTVVLARRPLVAVRLGGWAARHAPIRRLVPSADQQHVVSATQRFSNRAHRILSASWFLPTGMPALAELLLDAASLYLFFLAVGYRSELGAILVAYAAANILAVIPVTSAGLGVIEATLVAVTVAYGAPVQLAVLAVLGYRVANFWLPLPIGLACSVHLRVTRRRRRERLAKPDAEGV